MKNGKVVAICVTSASGQPMTEVLQVMALAGRGLEGDRYCIGEGSFNKGNPGKRQVTLMNAGFFWGSGFKYTDSRRNIFVDDMELMRCINLEFHIGTVVFRGVKYCEPCNRPSKLVNSMGKFHDTFFDMGGLIADILTDGLIKIGDEVVPPPKSYKED